MRRKFESSRGRQVFQWVRRLDPSGLASDGFQWLTLAAARIQDPISAEQDPSGRGPPSLGNVHLNRIFFEDDALIQVAAVPWP